MSVRFRAGLVEGGFGAERGFLKEALKGWEELLDLLRGTPESCEGSTAGDSDGKESVCNVGLPSSTPSSGRSPGEGNGNPLQYSCLENSMDRGAWQAIVHGVAESQTQQGD